MPVAADRDTDQEEEQGKNSVSSEIGSW